MATEQTSNTQNTTSSGANSVPTGQTRDENSASDNTKNPSASTGNDIVSQVGSILRGDTGAIKNIYATAKESGGQIAGQAIGQAKEKASSALDERKTDLASGLGNIADGIRQVGSNLRDSDEKNDFVEITAKYGESLAGQIEKFSNYLDRKDVRELVRDVEDYARRNPAVFVGAAFGLGFLAARFLKTSNPKQKLMLREAASNGESYRESSTNSEEKENYSAKVNNPKTDNSSTTEGKSLY